MNDETKAALERAAELMSSSLWHEDTHKDAALIHDHIASETNAHDAGYAAAVADVVAWLRNDKIVVRMWRAGDWCNSSRLWLARMIEAGEHVGAAKGGDNER